ncbi:MAG TPA: cyanophycinase [Planctomycetaceae bacterium]|nr:cyanophycinase [Planctomycetaceae bacterium]|tara:strand:- start:1055 stop:1894 length:840 start_codon:yes stop_codon:yes gene_type:complete
MLVVLTVGVVSLWNIGRTPVAVWAGGEGKRPGGHGGTLVVVGGGGIPAPVASHFVGLAGGKSARIMVLPQASSRRDRGVSSVKMFKALGAQAQVVSLEDSQRAKGQIEAATAIWFPGGSQAALHAALDKAGLVEVIQQRHAAGLVIGGTSAGAAVMSSVMIPRSPESPGLVAGNTPAIPGLGLVPELIIDQHFVRRKRMNRLVGVVIDHPGLIGVGIGESTAIIVRGRRFRVMGKNSVVVIDSRGAKSGGADRGERQSVRGLQLHVFRDGQEFRFPKKR